MKNPINLTKKTAAIRLPRRQVLKLAIGSTVGAALLAGCSNGSRKSAEPSTKIAPSGLEAKVGYLPITDGTSIVLPHALGYYGNEGIKVDRPKLIRGWSGIIEAFQSRQIDIVHVLMPIAVNLRFGQDFPAKVVAWAHTDGSALTVRNDIDSVEELAGKTVAVPFWHSIHNVAMQMLLRKAGLEPVTSGEPAKDSQSVKLVVMAPPDMLPALANGSIAGYIVADPFNAAAEVKDAGKVLRFSGDIWLNHACCVAIAHEDITERNPDLAQGLVNAISKSQLYARNNRSETAAILSKDGEGYLPQPLAAIERALTHYDKTEYQSSGAIQNSAWENERIDFQPFPYPSYTKALVEHMKNTKIDGDQSFLQQLESASAHEKLVDDRYVRNAIKSLGGPSAFDIPDSLAREETIEV